MLRFSFSPEDIEAIKYERFHHPHPQVQQKMWTVWLKSCQLPHHVICRIAGITGNTVRAHLNEFNEGGVEAQKIVDHYRPQSELDKHQATIEEEFKRCPPASVAEARATIACLTGIERSPTQVRKFLHRMGMKFRKVAAVPAKADPVAQETFKKTTRASVGGGRSGQSDSLLRRCSPLHSGSLPRRSLVFRSRLRAKSLWQAKIQRAWSTVRYYPLSDDRL
jgi:transposase